MDFLQTQALVWNLPAQKQKFAIAAACMVAGYAFMYGMFSGQPGGSFHGRYLVALLPCMVILLAIGVSSVQGVTKSVIAAYLAAAIAFQSYLSVRAILGREYVADYMSGPCPLILRKSFFRRVRN